MCECAIDGYSGQKPARQFLRIKRGICSKRVRVEYDVASLPPILFGTILQTEKRKLPII